MRISNRLLITVMQAEGFAPRPYYCSEGKLTIGYGWNLEANDLPEPIAKALLKWKLGKCITQAEALVTKWENLSLVRRDVLTEMVYQLGAGGVSNFKRMIAALNVRDYRLAAAEMRTSRWYRQTTSRAERLADTMESGDE